MDLYREAINRFKELFDRVQRLGLNEPTAMTLATTDGTGAVSARMVLLKAVDERGLVFYTNLNSRKGQQLSVNPRAALCFFWDPLMEQVLMEGKADLVSEKEADAYWASRPRESQLASYASLQSQPLDSRKSLEQRISQCELKFSGQQIPRPAHWSGYRVVPDRIEFWKRGPARLNERLLYQKGSTGWTVHLLYP